MNVIEAIKTRRSIGKVTDEMPPREKIEKILESAIWAPNHFKTEPWRFTVLTGEGRNKLGDVYGKINVEKLVHPTDDEKKEAYEKGIKKALRAPVVIVIAVEPSDKEKVEYIEEIEAAACAVQNMMLTAHALGLASIWRTGKPAYTQAMKDAFNVSDKGMVLGYLYIGYPQETKLEPPKKKPVHEIAEWVE
ncbi:nitroreductase [Scopulibacillus daqui]|uniref:Putative NAD(P)H nitroreductase n=1 Tax=Scopulibacillus daqui TaxID=1469162 RepID=A0ABS2Q1E3_9BACL|nr:nitroreductase [Scopulibacillus daqui]MBM7645775.1 nitroreductase [Scopulibacillus daqui]